MLFAKCAKRCSLIVDALKVFRVKYGNALVFIRIVKKENNGSMMRFLLRTGIGFVLFIFVYSNFRH